MTFNKRNFKSLLGRTFGNLTVLKRAPNRVGNTNAQWRCRCSCGSTVIVAGDNLRRGTKTHCGCKYVWNDVVNKRFGRLVVTKRAPDKKGRPEAQYRCLCDCGKKTVVSGVSLRSGNTKSCGCLQREKAAYTGSMKLVHGMSYTRLYRIWSLMKNRCYNSRYRFYCNYGGRGIRVCRAWKNSSSEFFIWALDNGYAPNLQIDRMDNDGNYTPDNCRWATCKQQGRNKRNNVKMTLNGVTKTVSEWSEITGMQTYYFKQRRLKGWTDHDILSVLVKNTA